MRRLPLPEILGPEDVDEDDLEWRYGGRPPLTLQGYKLLRTSRSDKGRKPTRQSQLGPPTVLDMQIHDQNGKVQHVPFLSSARELRNLGRYLVQHLGDDRDRDWLKTKK